MQVHEQVSGALEAHGSEPGSGAQNALALEDSVAAPATGVPAPETAATAEAPPKEPVQVTYQAETPDLIDFGDDPEPAAALGAAPALDAVPSTDAPAMLPDSDGESPVAVGIPAKNGTDVPGEVETVEDVAHGVQEELKIDANKSENPFA